MTASFLSSPVALYAGLAAAFGALALLLVVLLPTHAADATKTLLGQLGEHRPRLWRDRRKRSSKVRSLFRDLGAHRAPRRSKPTAADRLELAGWPLRPSEFQALRAVGGGMAGLFGFALSGSPILLLAFAVAGFVAPRLVLHHRIDRRTDAFTEQLPDTLHLLAASLESGLGILQAIDAVVTESPAPTSEEFARVLAEVRLGASMSNALEGLTERIDSDELRWVVLALNVQREVGGNLAVLLKTVADTLHEREQLRRQVKTLTAEGRISAIVLSLLPVGIALYLAVANPNYLTALFRTAAGIAMLLGAVLLMGIGTLWMRRLVRIEA